MSKTFASCIVLGFSHMLRRPLLMISSVLDRYLCNMLSRHVILWDNTQMFFTLSLSVWSLFNDKLYTWTYADAWYMAHGTLPFRHMLYTYLYHSIPSFTLLQITSQVTKCSHVGHTPMSDICIYIMSSEFLCFRTHGISVTGHFHLTPKHLHRSISNPFTMLCIIKLVFSYSFKHWSSLLAFSNLNLNMNGLSYGWKSNVLYGWPGCEMTHSTTHIWIASAKSQWPIMFSILYSHTG